MAGMWRGIVLLGPPGSGKGTQGRAIGALPGFLHYSCGEHLRETDLGTELGQKVRKYTESGELAPSALVMEVYRETVREAIEQGDFDPGNDTILLDGLPRDIDQARELELHMHIERVIHMACAPKDLLIQRIQQRSGRRADDLDTSVIEHRFKIYEDQTAALLDFYPAALITDVDAMQPPLRVLHEIVQTLLENCNGNGS